MSNQRRGRNNVQAVFQGSKGKKNPPPLQPRKAPPPQPRVLNWVLPPDVQSGTLVLSRTSLQVTCSAGGVNDIVVDPAGLLIADPGEDETSIDVTITAPAVPGRFLSATKQGSIRVWRAERRINWNLRDVWQVGEEIELDDLDAECEPDYPALLMAEPTDAFVAAADDVEVHVYAEETNRYQHWWIKGSVKVVDSLSDHAKDVALNGMKDGSLWMNGGASPQLTAWNNDTGKMKEKGQKMMSDMKTMTGDQLMTYMDKQVTDVNTDRQDERITKPTKQFPNMLWKLPNGLQVRYKPRGDAFSSTPAFCIEARTTPGFTTGQPQIAFKVNMDGTPSPPGPGATIVPDWVRTTNNYVDFMNTACDTTHLRCAPKKDQVITRGTINDIFAGVALTEGQLGITALDNAKLTYKDDTDAEVKTGSTLTAAGDHDIEATAAATDLYDVATENFTVTVKLRTATITWKPPVTEMVVGTAVGLAGLLNATSSNGQKPGYKRGSNNNLLGDKSKLPAGDDQELVAFLKETGQYAYAEARIKVNVKRKPQTVKWTLPKTFAPVIGGNLGPQLFAAAKVSTNVAPRFETTTGKVVDKSTNDLPLGEHTVIAIVDETTEYVEATAQVTFTVARRKPGVAWSQPKPIDAGQTLGDAKILNATAPTGLTPEYRTGSGTAIDASTTLEVGDHVLFAWTPETETYLAGEQERTIKVQRRKQTVTWENPLNIDVGVKLAETGALNATALGDVKPHYTLANGQAIDADTTLPAGEKQKLIAIADETAIYAQGVKSVVINVRRLPQSFTWNPADSINAGDKLASLMTATAAGEVPVHYFLANGTEITGESTLEAGDGQRLFGRTVETDTYAEGETERVVNVKPKLEEVK